MARPGREQVLGGVWRRSARRFVSLAREVAAATGWEVWNPGAYGERWHSRFRSLYPPIDSPLLVVGLNPGPYGMAQTGIPFTDIKRLTACLPALASQLAREGESVRVPGLAPTSLRRYLTRTFESSSVRVYRFLVHAFGDAEHGSRGVVVANPCPLLFLDPGTGKNVTPADLGRAVRRLGTHDARALVAELDRLRWSNCEDALRSLTPRGVVLLGRNVQAAVGERMREALGSRSVLDHEHPARAVPDAWASGLATRLRARGLLPGRRDF
jgi:single-strand selective monofunctional uracil DNA glycosylase